MSTTLHDNDLAAWANDTAALLRQGAELDEERRDQIAEELEAMARSDRRERDSRSTTLIMHLLKMQYQPEKHSRSWELTIKLQRVEIKRILRQSPSLKYGYEESLPELYQDAKSFAETETGLNTFPEQNPFTLDQILHG